MYNTVFTLLRKLFLLTRHVTLIRSIAFLNTFYNNSHLEYMYFINLVPMFLRYKLYYTVYIHRLYVELCT